jgi:DNA-binding response OmpR family regulator
MSPAIAMSWPEHTRNEVRINGRPVRLMPQRHKILAALLLNRGRLVSLNDLIGMVWPHPDNEPEWPENVVKVQVSKMRQQVGKWVIETVWGRGFRIPHEHELAGVTA